MRVKMLKSAKGPALDAPAGREVVLSDDMAKIFIARGYAVSLEVEVAETAVEEAPVETAVEEAPEEAVTTKKKTTKKKA